MVAYDKQNANAHFIKHYVHFCTLRAIMLDPNEPRERRQQATSEIAIAERKMDHWERHRNFDRDKASREQSVVNRALRNSRSRLSVIRDYATGAA